MRYAFIITAGMWLMGATAAAQNKKAPVAAPTHLKITVVAKSYEDSIVIRWAPENPPAWIKGNQAGYYLTRFDYSDAAHPVKSAPGPQPILPSPEKELLSGLDTSTEKGRYRLAAAKILYSNANTTTRLPATSFGERTRNQHSALNLRYMVAMMLADYNPAAADAMGLRWVDHHVKRGVKYIYVLTAAVPDPHYTMDSAAVLVVNLKAPAEAAPHGLEAYGFDHNVQLRWNRRQSATFSGYYIERSDDGGKTYRTLTHAPYNSSFVPASGDRKKDSLTEKANLVLRDHQVFADSVQQNYKTYYYRIRAINVFGEMGVYSEPVAIQTRDLTPPVPPVADSARNLAGNHIKVWWTQHVASADLAGYYVDRGTSVKGPFYSLSGNLLDKHTNSFTDSSALPHQNNYYVVIAVDTAGNAAVSAPTLAYLTDSLAPASPVGLKGSMDSGGVVRLHWHQNTEPDLLGYRIFSSYDSTYHFAGISNHIVKDTVFTDTISMTSLNRQVYYKIIALDKNYNQSGFSALTTCGKPVVVPPSAPVAGQVTVKGNQADIEWIESRSAYAVAYQVYRKQANGNWQPLMRLKENRLVKSIHFTDTTIQANTDYLYCAETIDTTGIRSERSLPVHIRNSERKLVPAPDQFTALYDKTHHNVALKWNFDGPGDYFFVVYRGAGSTPLAAWKSYDKTNRSTEDYSVQSGSYQYAVKIVYRDSNLESALSPPVKVDINTASP